MSDSTLSKHAATRRAGWLLLLSVCLVLVAPVSAETSSSNGLRNPFSRGESDTVLPASRLTDDTPGSESGLADLQSSLTSETVDVPDPAHAFTVSATISGGDSLRVSFDILPCCYLYQERIELTPGAPDFKLGTPAFSAGVVEEDEFFGRTTIHRDRLEIEVPVRQLPESTTSASLTVRYQGCSDAGICYPPQESTFDLPLTDVTIRTAALSGETGDAASESPAKPAIVSPVAHQSEQDRLRSVLVDSGYWSLPVFFGLGILLAFTPCVFPMVPILSGIITADRHLSSRRGFLLSGVYVLAMALTYSTFGILAAATGANIQVAFQHPAVLISFSLLFVGLALSMFGVYSIQMPTLLQEKITSISARQSGGRYVAVATMGALSALIVGPCVAAPLIGVLSYISLSGDLSLGGITLFVMGLGMGVPLMVIGTSAGRLLPKAGPWMNTVKSVFGIGLLAVSIWMLERVFAPWITMILWASLALGTAAFLTIGRPTSRRALPLLGKAIGHALAAYGVLILVGAASGATDPLRPLQALAISGGSSKIAHPTFRDVASSEMLDDYLSRSAESGIPVMLDYYADWCISCKEMEKYTFSDSRVASLMSRFILVQVDVTENDDADKALLERFGILGPPAIVFLLPTGQEATGYRVMGFMNARDFAGVLENVLTLSDTLKPT